MKNLKIPEALLRQRAARLKRLIELDLPADIIAREARLLARSFRYPLRDRFHDWQLRSWPHWLFWLWSPDYREVCRDAVDPELAKAIKEKFGEGGSNCRITIRKTQ